MTVNLPTKTPDASPGTPVEKKPAENTPAQSKPEGNKPAESKFDRFHPEMPQIPGVSAGSRRAQRGLSGIDPRRMLQIGGVAAGAVLIGAMIFWWVRSKPRAVANPAVDTDVAEQPMPAPALPNSLAPVHEGPTVAATVEELSKPWAAKKFTFIKPVTQENINAMLIRLPNGELWAFALQGPLGRCDLEFVTDLGKLASQYKYHAGHPMVVSPCDGTVYDPLKVGGLGGNTWVRGEIVQGSSLRPPISIEVKVRGRSIVADSIE
jgi:hypothetical protein